MARACSQDLRDRVIDAVVIDGMSRNGAAARFGVSVASAVRWVQGVVREGRRHPVGTGGHRASKTKPQRIWLLSVIEMEPDMTLAALSVRFWKNAASRPTPGCYRGSFGRRASASKKACCPASKTDLTWRGGARAGSAIRERSIPGAWSLSTRPGPRPI